MGQHGHPKIIKFIQFRIRPLTFNFPNAAASLNKFDILPTGSFRINVGGEGRSGLLGVPSSEWSIGIRPGKGVELKLFWTCKCVNVPPLQIRGNNVTQLTVPFVLHRRRWLVQPSARLWVNQSCLSVCLLVVCKSGVTHGTRSAYSYTKSWMDLSFVYAHLLQNLLLSDSAFYENPNIIRQGKLAHPAFLD